MRLALAVLLLFAAASVRADDGLDRSCTNEMGLFCPGRTGQSKRRCLRDHRDAALPGCRDAIRLLTSIDDDVPVRAAASSRVTKPEAEREARLVGVTGTVYLHKAGSPEGEFVAAMAGIPLFTGDWLRVGLDGAAELALDGATSVGLSSGTDMALTSLSRAGTELSLALGSLTAKVAKLARGHRFRVRTPMAVAAVRGTEFVVEQDEADGDSRVAVVDEGAVEVSAASGGAAVIVRERQETSVRSSAAAPEAPRALTQMRARAEAYVSFRARAEQSAKTWTPTTQAARVQARNQFASQPTINAARLTGMRPQQKSTTTPQSFNRSPSNGGRMPTQPGGQTGAKPGGRIGTQPAGTQPGNHTGAPQTGPATGGRAPNTPGAPSTAPRTPAVSPASPTAPKQGSSTPAPSGTSPSNTQRRTAPPKR